MSSSVLSLRSGSSPAHGLLLDGVYVEGGEELVVTVWAWFLVDDLWRAPFRVVVLAFPLGAGLGHLIGRDGPSREAGVLAATGGLSLLMVWRADMAGYAGVCGSFVKAMLVSPLAAWLAGPMVAPVRLSRDGS